MPLNGARPAFFGSVALYLGDRAAFSWRMSIDEACKYLDLVGEFQASDWASEVQGLPSPTGLYISGAQPFSQVGDLENLLDRAKQLGMLAEVVSSTFWVDSEAAASTMLERLHTKLHLLTVSTSRNLLSRYGISALEWLLLAARKFDVSVQLLVAIGPGNPFPKELFSLEVVNCDTSVFRIEPMTGGDVSSGRNEIDGSFWPHQYLMDSPPRYARCAELMGFVIVPGGDVYPCSSGINIRGLRLGNLGTQTVREIIRNATNTPHINQLRNEGPFFLYEALRDSPESRLTERGYLNACDFHRHVLADSQ